MSKIRNTVLASLGVVVYFASIQSVNAANFCVDFSAQVPETQYHLGDVFVGPNTTVTMRDYILNGGIANPVNPAAQVVVVNSSVIAGGTAPEIRTYLLNPQVRPNIPAQRVMMKIAENLGGAAPHANIEVNGEVHEVSGGLATVDGMIIGNAGKGQAEIRVILTQTANGKWNQGTLELLARSGSIETFTVGGVQVYFDDLCWQN